MNYQRILVFGAHPDDEQTMAATMAKLSDMGVEVCVAIYTDGSEGYPEPDMKDDIVEIRRKEGEASDRLLGIKERYRFERPDMALVNDKETFQETIQLIRRIRPDAIFTHGPHDRHRDHINTSKISLEAAWQAGQPVGAGLGESWKTPHVLFYKGISDRPPDIRYDITGYAHKQVESRATQVSQHTLWGRTKEDMLEEARRIEEANEPTSDTFWLTGRTHLTDLPDA